MVQAGRQAGGTTDRAHADCAQHVYAWLHGSAGVKRPQHTAHMQ